VIHGRDARATLKLNQSPLPEQHSRDIILSVKIMAMNLNGILLPVTTPFTPDEQFDAEGLVRNVRRWNESGIVGYVILGSTGERVNLDEREYLQVIETARAAVPESMTFIAGAGQQSTRGTIQEIRRAAKAGAEAVLVITPHYYKSAITQAALVRYFSAVAETSPLPIILYSMPDFTGIKLEPETAAHLSQHENIIGIKESSSEVASLAEIVRLARRDFAVLVGNGTVLVEALQAGACGAILAVGCVVPELCGEIYRAVLAGQVEEAHALQQKLSPLALAVTKRHGIGGLKAAMEKVGYVGGSVRAPLTRPDEAARAEIGRLLHGAIRAAVGER
jgi:4-hydroxy-2-oxoglutarate aldolase